MTIRTPNDLQRYLIEHRIPAEIVHLQEETPSVPAAAQAMGVPVDEIGKTVIFFINEQPYAVIANGVRRVDSRKLAARFGVNRKKVKLADGDAVIRLTGYAPGTVPPLGHKESLPVLMEAALMDQDVVYVGGGGIAALLRIHPRELARLTNAELLSVLEDKPLEDPSQDSTQSQNSTNSTDTATSHVPTDIH